MQLHLQIHEVSTGDIQGVDGVSILPRKDSGAFGPLFLQLCFLQPYEPYLTCRVSASLVLDLNPSKRTGLVEHEPQSLCHSSSGGISSSMYLSNVTRISVVSFPRNMSLTKCASIDIWTWISQLDYSDTCRRPTISNAPLNTPHRMLENQSSS